VRPPKSQFTLGELMGLVALCALGFALLTTLAAPLGAGVLVVLPGFVIERAKGGTGIIGGTASGCVIPMVLALALATLEWLFGGCTFPEYLEFFPALYLLFVSCLVWSGLASSLLYIVDRRLRKDPRSTRRAPDSFDTGIRSLADSGIRFLEDDERTGQVADANTGPGDLASATTEGPHR
jgi:hypothetical protein